MLIDNNLIYLAGVITGDGHIKNTVKHIGIDNSTDYGITIHSGNKNFLEFILKIIKEKVKTKTCVKLGKRSYYISVRNKQLFKTLTEKIGIPKGKKSDIIEIPKITKENNQFLLEFIAGFFDTDGGTRGKSIGFCSASGKMINDLHLVLNKLKIKNTPDRWLNKKYNKEYYGLKISKKYIKKFIETIPLKNKERLDRICAGVPEWSNGPEMKIGQA